MKATVTDSMVYAPELVLGESTSCPSGGDTESASPASQRLTCPG